MCPLYHHSTQVWPAGVFAQGLSADPATGSGSPVSVALVATGTAGIQSILCAASSVASVSLPVSNTVLFAVFSRICITILSLCSDCACVHGLFSHSHSANFS